MKVFWLLSLLSLPNTARAGCSSRSSSVPSSNPPGRYAAPIGKFIEASGTLGTFNLQDPGRALKRAVLTLEIWDLDPNEVGIFVNGRYIRNIGSNCNNQWTKESVDVTNYVRLGQTVRFTTVLQGFQRRALFNWAKLELAFETPPPTAPPTTIPPTSPPTNPHVNGDPHFKTWAGDTYDFHGICDLVLLRNPTFRESIGMDIHIRTERMRIWSYVSSAVLRIGDERLEVMGGKAKNRYWINGKQGKDNIDSMTLPNLISGFPIHFTQSSPKSREFVVDLDLGQKVRLKTWNGFVSVTIENAIPEDFAGSFGLMGTFGEGIKMARDNTTVIDNDSNVFGQEWQVLSTEPILFHNVKGPQAPNQCEIPSSSEMRRRLRASIISKEDAEIACSQVDKDNYEVCVFDVMATNDMGTAGAYLD